MSETPLLQAIGGEESAAVAGDQFRGSASDAGERSPKPKRAAPSDGKKPQGNYLEPRRALETDEKPEKAGPPSVKMPEKLPLEDLPSLTADVLRAARAQASLESLMQDSKSFVDSAAASSLAAEAASFSKAVHEFGAGRDKKKRIADTELGKTGRILSAAALRAPASEAALAAVAIKMTEESFDILLSEDRKPAARDCSCRLACVAGEAAGGRLGPGADSSCSSQAADQIRVSGHPGLRGRRSGAGSGILLMRLVPVCVLASVAGVAAGGRLRPGADSSYSTQATGEADGQASGAVWGCPGGACGPADFGRSHEHLPIGRRSMDCWRHCLGLGRGQRCYCRQPVRRDGVRVAGRELPGPARRHGRGGALLHLRLLCFLPVCHHRAGPPGGLCRRFARVLMHCGSPSR